MLLVYTHKITPRVKYVFKHICTRILGLPVAFTTTIEEFIAHDSLKMSYTKQPLSNEISIRSHELLFEQGLNDIEIQVHTWGETKGFFPTGEKSALPYDIFAASFYLLSRYEEYLPHVKDAYGRFPAEESIAYNNNFLHEPIVDIWAYKFEQILQDSYPDFKFETQKYQVKPVIDVPEAYSFKQKGIMRSIGGSLQDLAGLKFKRLYTRFSVLFGLKRDPFDNYKYIINKQKQSRFKFIFFFLIGDYSTYDKNININNTNFVSLIKQVSDYSMVGLKASFLSLTSYDTLKREKERMESVINSSLIASRNSYSKISLPESYRNLVELEIQEDYTMGFVNHIGFRAGTCTPFLFYDLDYEVQTPLKVYSYNLLDYALLKTNSLLDEKKVLNETIEVIKKVNGTFIPVFHNYTFSNLERWSGFKELFKIIIESPNNE